MHLNVAAKGVISLSDILRDFKNFTSGEIIGAIEKHSKESRKYWTIWIFSKAGEKIQEYKKTLLKKAGH